MVKKQSNPPKTITFSAEEMQRGIEDGTMKPIWEDEIIKDYHQNGTLKHEGIMGPMGMQGYWKYYFEDGVLEAEKTFKDGKKMGFVSGI